jgi:hypothetical protein
MEEELVQQILDELLSTFEPLDTQCAALLQFLKAKGIATDEELKPFLEQAGNASNVRWLAARVRLRSLISSAMKPSEQPTEKSEKPSATESPETADKRPEPETQASPQPAQKKARQKSTGPESRSSQETADHTNPDKANGALPEPDQIKKDQTNKDQTKKDQIKKDQIKKPTLTPAPSRNGSSSSPATPKLPDTAPTADSGLSTPEKTSNSSPR